jgi:hypothetical protein
LLEINQSLFMSEIVENSSLIVPFDKVKIGAKLKDYMGKFDGEKVFHTSAIQTLV